MNQKGIVKLVSEKTGHSKKDISEIYVAIFQVIKEQILFGIEIKIYDFCSFRIVTKKERSYKTPTGVETTIPKHYSLKAVFSRVFLKQIRSKKVY